jgi:hypothetical protein
MDSPTIVQDVPELQRVEDLWFEDGTLVLQAESSIFRIYKSILSIKSSVLRGILSKSQNQQDGLIEDCPVVRLDDSAEDLTDFLKAIYDAEYVPGVPSSIFYFSQVLHCFLLPSTVSSKSRQKPNFLSLLAFFG